LQIETVQQTESDYLSYLNSRLVSQLSIDPAESKKLCDCDCL